MKTCFLICGVLLILLAGCAPGRTPVATPTAQAQATVTPRPAATLAPAPTASATSTPEAPEGTILVHFSGRLWAMSPDGSGRRALTGPDYTVWSFDLSPDGRQVAFCAQQEDKQAVYVMDANGTGLSRLSPASENDCYPAWSPQGDRIALLREVTGGSQIIHTMSPDGSNVTPVAEAESMVWSPDGQRIALLTHRGGEQATIRVINADGTDERVLLEGPLALGWTNLSWSPDGSRVLVNTMDVDILTVSADGSEQTKIARGEWPAWSPDGRRIAFVQREWEEDGEITSWAVLTMDPDGTGQESVLGPEQMPEDTYFCARPSWSPDGRRILVVCFRDIDGDGACGDWEGSLWAVGVDGTGPDLVAEEVGAICSWEWIEGTLPTVVTALPLPTPEPAPPPPVTWVIETVDAPKQFHYLGERSLALDADENPHIAYGADHLYYAWHDGAAWHLETVDPAAGVGRYASLALDATGGPRISYYDDLNDDLKYAHYDGSTWQIETVDESGLVGEYTSLALDVEGHPHISYLDRSNDDLKYARHDGSAWQIETVESEGRVGRNTSLILDPAGRPHIIHGSIKENSPGDDLRYTYYDGSTWQTEIVDHDVFLSFGYASLVLDEETQPRVAYYDMKAFELRYARYDGTAWQVEVVDNGGEYGGDVSMALDDSGRPHISYYDQHNDQVKHAHYDGAAWRVDVVESALGHWAGNTSLALDLGGRPHMSYTNYDEYSGNGKALRYAHYDGSSWQIEIVDKGGDLGGSTSLALDSNGHPHVGYVDSLRHELKYAHHDGVSWSTVVVDTGGHVGAEVSLALDAEDLPHMAFYSYTTVIHGFTDTDLMYAHHDGSSWRVETVESEGNVGSFVSLAVDSAGRPHIAYFDHTHGALKYATQDGTSWRVETADDIGWVGWYASLALDSQDHPHIAYYDMNNQHLKYAHHDGRGWHVETVDDSQGAGWYISLALDRAGHPHVSYTDWDNDGLKYAYHDGVEWRVQWVGAEGHCTSLAVDGAGRPHISLYDWAGHTLKYIYNDGSRWHFLTVDGLGAPGDNNSLALDAAGLVHISYYDWTTGDVRYAHQVLETPP